MNAARTAVPNVLSIAGSDPSGGAGIQADLKTFGALGCYGMAAVAALTAQNTVGVAAIHITPPPILAAQIEQVFADIDVAAVKIGMLGSAANVETVADVLSAHREVPIVVDPVLMSTSGVALADQGAVEALHRRLFPLAILVTPNLAEAARLASAGAPVSHAEIEHLARTLRATGRAAWLLKGGHATGAEAEDFFMDEDEVWLSSPRRATKNTHGTGCTLSAAIAAYLGRGLPLRGAVTQAKAYVDIALSGADRLQVGKGPGPLDHFAAWRD